MNNVTESYMEMLAKLKALRELHLPYSANFHREYKANAKAFFFHLNKLNVYHKML